MKKTLTLVLSMLLLVLITGSAEAKSKRRHKTKPVTTLEMTQPATPSGAIPAPHITPERKQVGSDPTSVMKPGPITTGPPKELHLTRAASRRFDLRALPHTPPVAQDRAELPDPEHTPVSIQGGVIVPESNRVGTPPVPLAPAPPPIAVYEGLDRFNWGAGSPPDTNGDVGPTHYIQTVNTSLGVYRKSDGFQLAAFTFNTFMSQGSFGNLCDTNNFGDPVVLYDTFEDRWIVTDFAFTTDISGNVLAPAYQCIAASMTGDPVSGGWNFYSIQITDALNDYPKFGIWTDGLYMSSNMFSFGAGSSYQGARAWAFNKAQMYAGAPTAQIVQFNLGPGDFTVVPSNARLQTGTPPPGRPNLYMSTWNFLNAVTVYKFHVDWTSTSLSTFTGPDTPLAATSWPNAAVANAGQPGTATLLDVLQIRAMVQNQYTKFGPAESLWVPHTVRRGNTSGFAAPRWYQVDVTGGTVAANIPQATTWDPDGANVVNRFMPSLALDRAGNMAMGYSTSNTTTEFPSIKYAGRLAADPVNTFSQTEQTFFTGTASQTGTTRWGDYSSMTLDPDGCTFWYTSEYANPADQTFNHRWLTKLGSFGPFPGCVAVGAGGTVSGTVTVNPGGAPISGATVMLGSRTTTTNGSGVYSFTGIPAGTYPTMTASFPGYVSGSASGIVVTDGNTTTQNFSLTAAPTNACLTDTTQADFLTGVPSSGVDLNASPGDVLLSNAPVVDQQNTAGTTTGTGFGTPNWTGQTFIAGINGTLVKADVTLFCNGCGATPPNLTLSVRATSAGLPTGADLATATVPGSTFASGSTATFTATFGAPATLTSGTQYAVILRPVSVPAGSGYFWIRSSPSTYASGSRVLSADSGGTWSADTTRDYNFKTYMQTGYAPSGTFVSSTKDANPGPGLTPIWSTLSWNATTPAQTAVQFQLAGSNSISGPFNFVGPDGTAGTFFTTSPASLSQFYGRRYLQYKAFLSSTNPAATPTLSDVTVCYTVQDCSAPATITPATPGVCPNSVGNTASGPAGATSYQWSITNGTIVGSSTSQTVTYTAGASGSVGLNLTIVVASGCQLLGAATIPIGVPATPTITPAGPTTFCAGGSVTLNSDSATGNQWYLNGNPIGGATGTSYIATLAGDYTVVVTDGNGCSSSPSAIVTVTVNPLPATPTITPSGPTTFCTGGSVTLTSSAASGNQWFLNGNPIGGATNNTYVATATGSYTVTVTASGCTSAASAATAVTVNPIPATPTITPGGPTTFCAGGSVTLTSSSATGNQWFLNGNPIGGATNNTYVAGVSGNYTVTVTASGCTSAPSAATAVTVNANPNATITAPSSVVATSTGNAASVANAGVGATYAWTATNGVITGGIGTSSITFTAGVVPSMSLQVTVTTAAGCSDTKSVSITVTPNVPPVTVTNITPNHGTYQGGTAVTITGTGFLPGASVTIGGNAATGVVVNNSTTIHAVAPAGPVGPPVNVTVTNTNTASGTLTAGYHYTHQFDANNDGTVDPSDIFYLVKWLFDGGPPPSGPDGMLSGDANNDGVVDPADVFYIVNYLFKGGPAPASVPGRTTDAAAARLGGELSLGMPIVRNGRTYIPVILTVGRGMTTPQAISLKVDFDEVVGNVAIRRTGAASHATPMFEMSTPSRTAISYLVSFDQRGGGLTLNAGPQVIAEIELTGRATIGGTFDKFVTMLSNADGTSFATAARGTLKLTGTSTDNEHPIKANHNE